MQAVVSRTIPAAVHTFPIEIHGTRRCPSRRAAPWAPASNTGASCGDLSFTPQQHDAASLDVSGAVVQPVFRVSPTNPDESASGRHTARIAVVSESGVCRCVLAAAALQAALAARGLAAAFEVECRASRDYCVGEGPDPAAAAVAAERGWALPAAHAARQFEEAADIVDFDLVVVMDKFVAADVLREVSVFDTIHTWGKAGYSGKVRRLGEFAPELAAAAAGGRSDPDAADIGDPLYGNVEPEAEVAAVQAAAAAIHRSCEGLADFLAAVALRRQQAQPAGPVGDPGAELGSTHTSNLSSSDCGSGAGANAAGLGPALTAAVREMGAMDWLVPPMLAPR